MREIKTKLGQNGRVVIPTEYRRKLGIESGDEIIIRLDEAGLRLYTPAGAVARAQALVRRYVPKGRSLSGELISDRRKRPPVSEVVLDASALLALLNEELGHEKVAETIPSAAISAVNLSEVAAKLAKNGMPGEEIREALEGLALEIHDFEREQAFQSGLLRTATRSRGLSLGDRACLALGQRVNLPVLTTDRTWEGLELGVEIQLARS